MGQMTLAGTLSTGVATRFFWAEGIFRSATDTGPEASGQFVAPKTGTISRIKGKMVSNTFDTPTTITLRINGVATAATFTIPAGDASDFVIPGSFAVVSGDLIAWEIVRSATVGALADLVITYDYD